MHHTMLGSKLKTRALANEPSSSAARDPEACKTETEAMCTCWTFSLSQTSDRKLTTMVCRRQKPSWMRRTVSESRLAPWAVASTQRPSTEQGSVSNLTGSTHRDTTATLFTQQHNHKQRRAHFIMGFESWNV